MYPRFQPLLMPLPKNRHLEDQRPGFQKGVEAAAEGVAVDVKEVLICPGMMLRGAVNDAEEFVLGGAVARVALADVGEVDVKKGFVVLSRDVLDMPFHFSAYGLILVDQRRVEGVDLLYSALAMLAPPAAVAGEAPGRGAPPVHFVFLVFPGVVLGFFVRDFVGPVPGGGVEDILEGADFALGEDGEEIVDDVEGVGAVE